MLLVNAITCLLRRKPYRAPPHMQDIVVASSSSRRRNVPVFREIKGGVCACGGRAI